MAFVVLVFIISCIGWFIYYLAKIPAAHEKGRQWGRQKALAEGIQQGRKPIGEPISHQFGSAYLMSPEQMREKGIGLSVDDFFQRWDAENAGVILLGTCHLQGDEDNSVFNVLEKPGHLLTIAPTRTGKGTCAVIPNLLGYDGSVIVNDIKGENYAVTSRCRKTMGHAVYKVAPFDDDTAMWNPFDVLSRSDDAWDDAKHIAELLITDAPGNDQFWNNQARNLLTGLILFIHHVDEENRTLTYLRTLMTQDEEDFKLTLAEMVNSENKVASRAANVFLRSDIKVQSGILSTLDSELSFLDSERLERCTQTSDFNFKDLKEEKVSIYLVIPPERLRTYAPFLRLFMGMAALELKRVKTKPSVPVLLMMDEFPALGRMKVIEEEISYLAGYDVRLWLFAQDLKQLTVIYGDHAQSIIANCAVKQFFGVADYDTAKLVSLMCGNTTVPNISVSSGSEMNIMTGTESVGSSARALYDPNEVMNLHPNMQLLFYQGQQPVLTVKLNYLEAGALFAYDGNKVYDDNPFYS
ncbi:MAG: type IV secretory system conjugative DNA transfer family protein [Wenzhouxiangellaceae bacterium]